MSFLRDVPLSASYLIYLNVMVQVLAIPFSRCYNKITKKTAAKFGYGGRKFIKRTDEIGVRPKSVTLFIIEKYNVVDRLRGLRL